MNASGQAILTHPQPSGHIVYPYTDEAQFADAVCLFVSAGLMQGESALLLLERSHCELIRRQLEKAGFDVNTLEATGQLACVTAEDFLATCVFDGIIDEYVFKLKVGRLILQAKAASEKRHVRVFGEMVNLLWMPHPGATQRLEELWNELISVHSVPLLCAYALGGTRPDVLDDALLACHSAVAA